MSTCADCGGPLPMRPWGRPTPDGAVPICTPCLIRWRDQKHRATGVAVLGWIVLGLLALFCIGLVTVQ